jgi:hypothetical protein
MQWLAWGEMKLVGKNDGVEEACITVQELEPTEGNESSNCAPPSVSVGQIVVHSPYGLVTAGMWVTTAKRAIICVKGGKKVIVPLKTTVLRAEPGGPTQRYAYFARGFAAGTRITSVSPLLPDGTGTPVHKDNRCA